MIINARYYRFSGIVPALLAMAIRVFAQSPPNEIYNSGKASFDKGNYLEAIDKMTQAIKLDSAFKEAYYIRGISYLKLYHSDSAVKDLTRSIALASVSDPANSDLYLYRGIANMESKNYQDANDDFEKAKNLNSSDPEIYYEYSRLKFITMDDKSPAITELNMAINLKPQYAPYYAKRAEYKKFESDYNFTEKDLIQSAIRDMTIAIYYDSLNYNYYRFRSDLYKDIGEPDLAVEDYTHMIHLKPHEYEAYAKRGVIRMQDDDYKAAISDFTSAIINNPGDDKNYRYRGLCKFNSSDYNGANKDFSFAILLLNRKIDQSSDKKLLQRILADTYIKRGVTEIMMGNNINSCDDFRKAYQLGNSRALNYYRKYCGF